MDCVGLYLLCGRSRRDSETVFVEDIGEDVGCCGDPDEPEDASALLLYLFPLSCGLQLLV